MFYSQTFLALQKICSGDQSKRVRAGLGVWKILAKHFSIHSCKAYIAITTAIIRYYSAVMAYSM